MLKTRILPLNQCCAKYQNMNSTMVAIFCHSDFIYWNQPCTSVLLPWTQSIDFHQYPCIPGILGEKRLWLLCKVVDCLQVFVTKLCELEIMTKLCELE